MTFSNAHCSRIGLTLAALLMLFTLFGVWLAYGQATQFPPGKMTFQGFLTDASNPPVPLGNSNPENKTVTFRIYKNATSAASADLLWAEQQIVTVDKGHFSVLMGEGSSVSGQPHATDLSGVFIGADASERWLGITVDGNEITPRIQFFAAPYSQLARAATSLTSGAAFSGSAQIGTAANPAFTLEFGAGKSGKHADAGKIGYESVTTGALDIVGAGPASGSRKIKLWDIVEVGASLGVGTGSPNGKLDVVGGNNGSSRFQFFGEGGSYYALRARNSGDSAYVDTVLRTDDLVVETGTTGAVTERLRITDAGNVGIGTTSPEKTLSVIKNLTAGTWANMFAANPFDAQMIVGDESQRTYLGAYYLAGQGSAGVIQASDYYSNSDHFNNLLLNPSGGSVGIGTTTPSAKLHLNGSMKIDGANVIEFGAGVAGKEASAGKFGYATFTPNPMLDIVGANPPGSQTRYIKLWDAVYISGWAVAPSFTTQSDARIKQVIGHPVSETSLESIRRLQVTDFRFLDTRLHGQTPTRGFIAQEIEKVLPNAVTQSTDFVPDIYAPAIASQYDAAGKSLTITLKDPHGLNLGDMVRLNLDRDQKATKVIAVPSSTRFVVEAESEPGKVFVFGKQVSDFRTVNYDHVFTTGISAIQELDSQVRALKQSEARIAELEQKAARVDSLERKVAQLEKLVAGLTQGQVEKDSSLRKIAAAQP